MIVQESDILVAALDRRLQVDRLLALDPLAPVGRPMDQPGSSTPSARPGQSAPAGQAAAARPAPGTQLAAVLPIGTIVTARVVALPQPGHVVAEVGLLRIELAWPGAGAASPRVGGDIDLRVLAHQPMLLFQSVAADASAQTGSLDRATAPRWSSNALSLQAQDPLTGAPRRAGGPVQFDAPILDIEIVALDDPARPSPAPTDAPRTAATTAASVPNTILQGSPQPANGEPAHIALDDVIVARSTAFVDGVASPMIPQMTDDARPPPVVFSPLVLQGPAWPGQAVELVVRREREDEQFDNPVLDHWCGDLLIDLPHLGRVAAHLSFSMKGLRVRIEGDDGIGVDAMADAASSLAAAFAGADLRVTTLTVGRPAADASRGDRSPGVSFGRSFDG